jgi:hypothetical protein
MLLAGTINGYRDNRGHWRIEEEDLPTVHEQEESRPDHSASSEHEQIRAARLEERLAAANNQLEELRADRDAWKNAALKWLDRDSDTQLLATPLRSRLDRLWAAWKA